MGLGLLLSLSLTAAGCGGGDDDDDDDDDDLDAGSDADFDAAVDAPIDAPFDPLAPITLEQSGLWSDFDDEVLADGVFAFEPSYILWSDGATKRRWIYLPPGSQIDTSDMNYWIYPVGTKLWKEFTSDDVRVETRLLFKTGDDTWYRITYKWNEEGTATEAVPSIGENDALGTTHDIPSRLDCDKCHTRMPDKILGFTALQLDHPVVGGDPDELNLDRLVDDGWLTVPPVPQEDGGDTYFTIPGDNLEGNPTRNTLGYLNANCGGCHHPQSDVFGTVDMVLKLDVTELVDPAVIAEQTSVWSTIIDVDALLTAGATARIEPGNPATSALYMRMSTRGPIQMPPVGTEEVDDTAVGVLEEWILSMTK